MIKTLFILIAILVSNNDLKSQRTKIASIHIEKPNDWIDKSNSDIIDNLKKYELKETQLNDLINSNRGSLLLYTYLKHNPVNYPGVIPTIQINLRPNPNTEFKSFKKSMTQSIIQMKSMLTNFQVIKELQEIEIDNKKCIFFLSSFDMTLPNGEIEKIRS